MSPALILACIATYFLLVFFIAYRTTRGLRANLSQFFLAGRSAPWWLVAFGMIGTTLSGVTFISVPGAVRESSMGYMQITLGYFLGYVVIALVLLPLYYRLRLTSIYSYLGERFGPRSYQTGAVFFLISRALGAAARLYLVAVVLQTTVFEAWGVPFALTTGLTLALIFLYTGRGGIRTILWTDTLQTTFMLVAAGLTLWQILGALEAPLPALWANSPHNQMFFLDDADSGQFFWKQLLAGALIALTMTGLDQDMMQKNLSVRSLRAAQTNVLVYGVVLIGVILLFVGLGLLLYAYANARGIPIPENTDELYPLLAVNHLGPAVGVAFILGLIAAAYSSADGSLTALTTSFCIDILGMDPDDKARQNANLRLKRRVHITMTGLFFLLILGFGWAQRQDWGNFSVIDLVLSLAAYTYGPLLGLYGVGIATGWRVRDRMVPVLAVLAPLLTWLLQRWGAAQGFEIGYLAIALNGGLMALGLRLSPARA